MADASRPAPKRASPGDITPEMALAIGEDQRQYAAKKKLEAAEKSATMAEALTVDAQPTRQEIADRCANIAALAVHNGLGGDEGDDQHPTAAMIGGAPWMMRALEDALADVGVQPVYAFSVRESVEQEQPDGSVRKINVFRHAGFVQSA